MSSKGKNNGKKGAEVAMARRFAIEHSGLSSGQNIDNVRLCALLSVNATKKTAGEALVKFWCDSGRKLLPRRQPAKPSAASSEDFLRSFAWRKVRMQALKKYGAKCMCCGASPATGAVMNVDHIKPRKLFPSLALDIKNLQVLCGECNHGKGNWDMTDWREDACKR